MNMIGGFDNFRSMGVDIGKGNVHWQVAQLYARAKSLPMNMQKGVLLPNVLHLSLYATQHILPSRHPSYSFLDRGHIPVVGRLFRFVRETLKFVV